MSLPGWSTSVRSSAQDAGELGEALELFQRVRAAGYKTPEVEMAMGDIFRTQGEPDLAEWHYRKAYELKAAFEAPGDRFTVLYEMADMFRQAQRYDRMEEALRSALAEASDTRFERLHDDVARVFSQSGIDRLLALYRMPDLPTARAHGGLAWYYSRTGRPADAVEHALFAMIIELSRAIEEYQRRLPHYDYESVSRFLSLAGREPDIRASLEQGTLPEAIYDLGVALQALGDGRGAAVAWHLLAGSPLEGPWRDRADRQLARPFPERLSVRVRPPTPAP